MGSGSLCRPDLVGLFHAIVPRRVSRTWRNRVASRDVSQSLEITEREHTGNMGFRQMFSARHQGLAGVGLRGQRLISLSALYRQPARAAIRQR